MKIAYITSNLNKFEQAKRILSEWELEQISTDLTEIQGDIFSIVKAKAIEAIRHHPRPLIVDDVSLHCNAIGGLPGPYIKDSQQKIGAHGLYELVRKYADHTAKAICVVSYIAPGYDPVLFEGIVEGTLVSPRGINSHGFSSIFLPHGSTKTWAEMSIEELSTCSIRYLALTKLKHHIGTK